MLKKIAISDLRMGMHLHSFEGSWVAHPFWRTRFTLSDPNDLDRIRQCGIRECWIDTSKGLDVPEALSPLSHPDPSPNSSSDPLPAASDLSPFQAFTSSDQSPRTLAEEMDNARAICTQGRQAVLQMLNEARLGRTVQTAHCLPLVSEITNSVMRNPGALVSLARLKTRDDYSYMHSVAVCALMVALARSLGLAEHLVREAGLAGLLHDIGKAAVPKDILNKPSQLTDHEYKIMRTHPVLGHQILVEADGVSEHVLDVCLHHHERVDGAGYPHNLSGDDISLLARMGAVCDVYDAITSNRPYKRGWDPAESIARMASWKGHFDTVVFQSFVRSVGIYPTGSLVRMQSQHLAIVVDQNPNSLLQPVVKIFYSLRSKMPVTPRLLDLSSNTCTDQILGREPAESWNSLDLDSLWAGPHHTMPSS
jgi:putative nucleotidyltransferase with HDIG domain